MKTVVPLGDIGKTSHVNSEMSSPIHSVGPQTDIYIYFFFYSGIIVRSYLRI